MISSQNEQISEYVVIKLIFKKSSKFFVQGKTFDCHILLPTRYNFVRETFDYCQEFHQNVYIYTKVHQNLFKVSKKGTESNEKITQ